MRRVWGDTAISVGALGLLLLALVFFDDRVREQITRVSSPPSVELANAGREVQNLAAVVLEAARDQSIAHAPLMLFVLAAVVLVLFMLRT